MDNDSDTHKLNRILSAGGVGGTWNWVYLTDAGDVTGSSSAELITLP